MDIDDIKKKILEDVDPETKRKRAHERRVQRFVIALQSIAVIIVVLLIFYMLMGISTVQGNSMYPTYKSGDVVLVNSLFYKNPKKNDIITFKLNNKYYIKRVIGVAGDTVDIDYADGKIIINGEEQNEDYIYEPIKKKAEIEFPQTVPEDMIFVLGDNRNNSNDSRSKKIGMIPINKIKGKVIVPIHTKNKERGAN